jgi:hypothetical protein
MKTISRIALAAAGVLVIGCAAATEDGTSPDAASMSDTVSGDGASGSAGTGVQTGTAGTTLMPSGTSDGAAGTAHDPIGDAGTDEEVDGIQANPINERILPYYAAGLGTKVIFGSIFVITADDLIAMSYSTVRLNDPDCKARVNIFKGASTKAIVSRAATPIDFVNKGFFENLSQLSEEHNWDNLFLDYWLESYAAMGADPKTITAAVEKQVKCE